MDDAEVFKHLQTLIKIASETDDPDLIHKLLREMTGVIKNAQQPPRPPKPTMPYLRTVK